MLLTNSNSSRLICKRKNRRRERVVFIGLTYKSTSTPKVLFDFINFFKII